MGRNERGSNRNNKNNKGNRSNRSRNNNRNNNKSTKKKSFNKNRRPKKLTPSRLIVKYQNLMEQYLLARKKFFDVYGHKNNQQVSKAERSYAQALNNLRTFEKGLEDWQKDVLKPQLDAYPEDRQYTSEHNLEPVGDNVSFVGEFEDPHLLPAQKAENWSADTEESEGTMDDYYNYKGITPPTPEPEQIPDKKQ